MPRPAANIWGNSEEARSSSLKQSRSLPKVQSGSFESPFPRPLIDHQSSPVISHAKQIRSSFIATVTVNNNPQLTMICSSCRRIFQSRIGTLRNPISASASASTSITSPSIRRHYASTAPATPNAAPSEPSPSIIRAAAEAASGTQPPSDAQTPSSTAVPTTPVEVRKPRKLKSSVTAGQELKGLGYTKAKPVIKALEDHEYPDWLWTLLDESAKSGDAAVDLSGKFW